MKKSVVIVSIDHYITRPSVFDENVSNIRHCPGVKVPVLRVFGTAENGEKICVHVHNVYPYFYVPYNKFSDGTVDEFKSLLVTNINNSLNNTFGTDDKVQHVYKIEHELKKSFYGYNDECDFMKISFYNPFMVRKASSLLLNSIAVANRCLQPYESHINYVLQFMIDFNLFGMSNLKLSKFVSRGLSKRECLIKSTICKQEIDVLSDWILNKTEIDVELGIGSNPGLREIWSQEKHRRNQSHDLSHQLTENRFNVPATKSHFYFENVMMEKFKFDCPTSNDSFCQNDTLFLSEIKDEEDVDNEIDFDSVLSQINKPAINNDEDVDEEDSNGFNFSQYLDDDFDCDFSNITQLDGNDDFDESFLDCSIIPNEDKNSINNVQNNPLFDENWVQVTNAKNDTYITLDWLPPTLQKFQKNTSIPKLENSLKNSPVSLFELKVAIVEIHINTRDQLFPDPEFDAIKAIFFVLVDNSETFTIEIISTDDVIVKENENYIRAGDEKMIIMSLVALLEYYDPDILIGYETESVSWGFIIYRGLKLGLNMTELLSRVRYLSNNPNKKLKTSIDSNFQPIGRILLNFWRILRHEISLQSYSFENVIYQCLNYRLAKLSYFQLSRFWNCQSKRIYTLQYYKTRVRGVIALLKMLDFVSRTSELARLFGIQFYEVLSRGSQFRVESIMLRLAKPKGFVALSPNFIQRRDMNAPEYLPLIMEPMSNFYSDPVLVLDFQSLYPSMIIAYNYCFSTCIGRVDCLNTESQSFKFGTVVHRMDSNFVNHLVNNKQLNYAPCGVGFVTKDIREGILPQMLHDILDARLLIKKSMKTNIDNLDLQKILHSRQLGLKLIANVTYGYTAANFSGRMPLVELGDSIVSKGRETLERAIELVRNSTKWGARVIYGDTDSLFVLLPGKSKMDAFRIGEEIAKEVTESNPSPVKLKFEKVYVSCFLQTKKRYVGYMYESVDQLEPIFDAKGIETVRRDTCPIVSQLLRDSLELYFKYQNSNLLKNFVCKEFDNILSSKYGLEKFIFAKEFRGFDGYSVSACVPSLELARKMLRIDKKSAPKRGERVPYVVVYGPPKMPLIKLVRTPTDLINDNCLKLNYLYYITKCIIPSLNRCFSLIRIDIHNWFKEMPKPDYKRHCLVTKNSKKATISQYFVSRKCLICHRDNTNSDFCEMCSSNRLKSYLFLINDKICAETQMRDINEICRNCTNTYENNLCISIDCPIFFKVDQFQKNLKEAWDLFRKFEF